jgi:hypothetical protein
VRQARRLVDAVVAVAVALAAEQLQVVAFRPAELVGLTVRVRMKPFRNIACTCKTNQKHTDIFLSHVLSFPCIAFVPSLSWQMTIIGAGQY